jgi:hypothetical protein
MAGKHAHHRILVKAIHEIPGFTRKAEINTEPLIVKKNVLLGVSP